MKDVFSRLVFQIKRLLSSERSYGCLPDASRDAHPAEKAGEPTSNRSQSANSVEKDASLR
jgi:hypothetical protein